MAGFKTFVDLDILTAAEVNDFLMKQAVMVFADAAARTTALPTPTEGMVTYLEDTDNLEVFTGASFVLVNDNTAAILKAIIDAKGDLIVGTAADTPARLAVGTNEHRLVADSGETTGLRYVADTTNYAIAAKGDLLAGTAADTLAALTVGTNGQVLTADSSTATGLAWAVAAGATGSLVKIAAASPSSVASVTFDNVFTSTYRNYLLLYNLVGSTADALRLVFRTSGSNNTTSNYTWQQLLVDNTSVTGARQTNSASLQIGAVGNADRNSGFVYLHNPQITQKTLSQAHCTSLFGGSNVPAFVTQYGHFNATTQFDGLQIFPLIGGNVTGEIVLYGLEN